MGEFPIGLVVLFPFPGELVIGLENPEIVISFIALSFS